MPNAVSGLAASIRSATEGETFDLAGQGFSTIEKQIRDALAEPLPLTEMIRLTFVTGAGKLGRQKYDEGAAKAVTGALRELGYLEDRGASAVLECAGSFKLQHDTGKNLKTVVVFPKVRVNEKDNSDPQSSSSTVASLLPEGSSEHKLAFSTMNVFQRNLPSKCATWSQKKACIAALDTIRGRLESLEQKLLKGTPLNDSEQAFYDAVSMSTLEDKQAHVKHLMAQHVEEGRLTASERRTLLDQVSERLDALSKEWSKGNKKVLTAKQQKAQERRDKLQAISPQPPPALKHEADIQKLRKELGPILAIEEKSKGRLLSLKENQAVARKQDILQEIAQLQEQSRGWFESDEAFQARVDLSESAWKAKQKPSNSNKKTSKSSGFQPVSYSLPTNAKWVTPGASKKKTGRPNNKPNNNKSAGGLFAAMMEDSDSD